MPTKNEIFQAWVRSVALEEAQAVAGSNTSSGTWVDAPADGQTYGRRDGAWVLVSGAVDAPANLSLPLISGVTTQGETLTVTNGTWSGTPTLSRQWKANGTAISGAVNPTYVLTAGEVGDTITVTVTATYPTGSPLTATSAATAAIASSSSESNLTLPTISGTAQVGQTLNSTNGTWTNTPTSLTRQWKRDGVAISGATGDAFTLTSADLGAVMTMTVTATYATGSPITATSAGTSAVVSAPVTAADVFADSSKTDDSGNGLSAATAKKTTAAALALVTSGQRLSLARGSYWREQIKPMLNMTIEVHGTGDMPILDGTDVVTGWTPAAGLTNVWEVTWVRPGPLTGNDWLGLWVDGVRPRQAPTNLDLRDGAPGGWLVDGGDYFAGTAVVRIQSATDPNTSGAVYELTRRNSGVVWHPNVSDSTAVVNLAGPVEAKRMSNHYNAIASGPGSVDKVFLRDGHIHHMVTSAAQTTNSLATEIRPNLTIPGVPFTAYRFEGTGFEHEFKNCLALFPGGANRIPDSQAFLAHGGSGTTIIDKLTLDTCVVRGMDGIGCASYIEIVKNSYFEDVHAYGIDGNGFTTTIDRCMLFDTVASLKAGGNCHIRTSSNTEGNHTITNFAGFTLLGVAIVDNIGTGSVTITNSSFVTKGGAGLTGGNAAVNYCVFDAEGRALSGIETGFSGDHNVFFSFSGEQNNPWLHYNGTLYSYEPMAPFSVATSSNANSVYTRYADQVSGNANAFWLGTKNGTGGPEVGDFRINPTCRVYGSDNVARVGTFMDGTPVTLAGPQSHWNHNTLAVVAGPPTRKPSLPTTIAAMRALVDNRASWNFYP